MIALLMVSSMLFMNVTAPGNCRGFPCCTKSVNNPSYDPKGTAYGFENGESCVVSNVDRVLPAAPPPEPSPKAALNLGPGSVKSSSSTTSTTTSTSITSTSSSSTTTTSSRTTSTTTTITTTTSTTPTSSSGSTTVSKVEPTPVVNGQIPSFPELPLPIASLDITCESANTILIADLEQCANALVNKVQNTIDAADKTSVEVVDCICTSHWRVGSKEVELSLKSSCNAPGNLTKSESLEIHNGCSIFPYSYSSIINAAGLYARLSNGDLYLPLTQRSGAEMLRPEFLSFGFGLTCLTILLKDIII